MTIHVIRADDARRSSDVLTDGERARAASFRFETDARRWIHWRASLRNILGAALKIPPSEVPLVCNEHGKPLLASPFGLLHFSLSHCDELALLALSQHGPVGVDIEPLSRFAQLAGCETTFCHPAEIATLPEDDSARCSRMLEIWTAKEALLKAVGTGFSHPPEDIRILTDTAVSETQRPGIEHHLLTRLSHVALDGYTAALATPFHIGRLDFA